MQKFRDDNDDKGWPVRRGSDMSELLQVVLPLNFPIPDTALRVIVERDPNYDPHDASDATFWSDDMRYQEESPTLEQERAAWDGVAQELKSERRFFSRRAEHFFGWLFEGIDDFVATDGSYEARRDDGRSGVNYLSRGRTGSLAHKN